MNHDDAVRSGVYIIYNTQNGKVYVGSSKCLRIRETQHWRMLKAGKHYNVILQNAWNRYGESAFRFEVVTFCAEEALIDMEGACMARFRSKEREFGYNIANADRSTMSEETKAKISKGLRGRVLLAESRLKISSSLKAHPVSEETRRKISAVQKGAKRPERSIALRGQKLSQEVKAKISKSLLGRVHTDESKAKMSVVQSRRTKETCLKLSISHVGKTHSMESKAKMSEAKKGKPWSEARRIAQNQKKEAHYGS